MGQEWAASTPFLYFTDHEPELGEKVSAGRRSEFKHFRAFSDPEQRARIPDPQDPATFQRSILNVRECEQGPHARVLSLYRRLLHLRKSDPVLRSAHREHVTAEAHGDVLIVRRWHEGDGRVLLANFGQGSRSLVDFGLPMDAELLLDSKPDAPRGMLERERALILSVREGAV
jgi:maltooligosyltrehalose trehalohydrolase